MGDNESITYDSKRPDHYAKKEFMILSVIMLHDYKISQASISSVDSLSAPSWSNVMLASSRVVDTTSTDSRAGRRLGGVSSASQSLGMSSVWESTVLLTDL